ncbi:MAG: 30S ribosomal protein S6 [Solirubrobacterales bacterium]
MAAPREYELVLMLDPGQDAPARDAVANEAKKQIEATGTLKHENTWGLRKMAYEIDQRTEADYRWFRFEAPVELLEQLDHNLKIADGVLRFRVFKVDADTPVIAPPATSAPGPGASRERPSAPEAPQAAPVEAASEPAAPEAPAVAPVAVAEPPAEAEPAAETAEPAAETAEPAAEQEASEAPAEGEPGDTPA